MPRRLFATMLLAVPALAGGGNEIIVSAPRLDDLDLMAVDTVADVTVIDRAAIGRSGAASVPDLLRSEANLLLRSTTGTPNDGQISMRGFGDNSQARVLVLVDGHKLNRPDMGSLEWEQVPVSNIERIEVVRGGQNVLYGNHALSGVVKITSRRGGDDGARTGGTVGSFGYLSGFVSHGGAAGDFDYQLGLSSYAADGFRSNSNSRATTAYGNIGWYPSDLDTLTLRGSYTDSQLQFPGPLTYEQMMDDPEQSNALGSDRSQMQSGLATLIWEGERDWGAARVASGFNLRDMDWQLGGVFARNQQTGVSFGPRARFGGEDDFLMAGVDSFYDRLEYENLHPLDTSRLQAEADIDRLTAAPYLFAQRNLGRGFLLNGGVRYEAARTDNQYTDYVDNQILPFRQTNRGTFPNPDYKNPPDIDPTNSYDGVIAQDGWAAEAALAYEIKRDWSVWTGYDRVYRYPTLDEAAAYQGYPLADPLNEELEPETGDNFELGTRFENRAWRLSATGFCLLMDNEIVFDDIENLNRNLGATRRAGLEAEAAWSGGGYGASTRWSLVDARIDGGEYDGNTVPLVPWANGVCSVWVEPMAEIRLTLLYSYVSEQYQGNDDANAARKLAAYGLVGFRCAVVLSDRASLAIAMDNLLDETYASSAYAGAYYPGAGRSMRCGITLEF